MILDGLLRVSNAQAFTATAISTDVIDFGGVLDAGEGQQLQMLFNVTTAFTGLTSVEFQVVGSSDPAMGTYTVLGSSGAILLASLTLGKQLAVELNPQIGSTGFRYLAARYVVTGTGTAGAVTAYLILDLQDGRKFYASGFSV
jgi:hypothetical protein